MLKMVAGHVSLLREAMRELRPVYAVYGGLPREFCPHVLGRGSGSLHVFVWQFGGESSRQESLPEWRCFRIAGLSELRLLDGEWHPGNPTKGHDQHCVDLAEAVVDPARSCAKLPPILS